MRLAQGRQGQLRHVACICSEMVAALTTGDGSVFTSVGQNNVVWII